VTLLITPAINTYLVDSAEERIPDGAWHPSSLFGCDRQALYEVNGTPITDPRPPEDYRALAIGKALHTLVQSAVTHDQGKGIVQVWHEVKVHDPVRGIKGSADSLVLLDDGTYEVEEFKTTKSIALKYAKKGGYPKPAHVSQALTYARCIRYYPFTVEDDMGVETVMKPLGGKLKTVRIVYIGKDNAEILEYVYDITPEWEVKLLDYLTLLQRYKDEGVLPPRLPKEDGKKPWNCSYCSWATKCWQVDAEGTDLG
jgi:CRISPR/Cas system-associated exonuclease Cas4 (RecB family)